MARSLTLLVFLPVLWAVGCNRADDRFAKQATIQVKGQLLVQGKPAEGAIVTFMREDQSNLDLPGAQGIVDAEGLYELTTYETKDGVIPGDYKVSVLWPSRADWWNADVEPSELDKLKGRYLPSSTKIQRSVEEGDIEIELIDLN